MNTERNKQHRLMIITVVAGLILAALAFFKPAIAEAGVTVTARVGNVGIAVSTEQPRGVITQTGPRSYRCDMPTRPPRPLYGHHIWVPGHYERVLEIRNCRQYHQTAGFKPGKGKYKRTKRDHFDNRKRGRKAPRHSHYREIWVPGHWERI
ncbi:MAG: hypothetical protein ABFS42_10310 [Candidatus Krumholzibacteriota bacterium]